MTNDQPTRRRPLYHHSPEDLPPGSLLLPVAEHGGEPQWPALYAAPEHAWRAERVWMFATAAEARDWGGGAGHVYAVLPHGVLGRIEATPWDSDNDESVDMGEPEQFHAPRATILSKTSL